MKVKKAIFFIILSLVTIEISHAQSGLTKFSDEYQPNAASGVTYTGYYCEDSLTWVSSLKADQLAHGMQLRFPGKDVYVVGRDRVTMLRLLDTAIPLRDMSIWAQLQNIPGLFRDDYYVEVENPDGSIGYFNVIDWNGEVYLKTEQGSQAVSLGIMQPPSLEPSRVTIDTVFRTDTPWAIISQVCSSIPTPGGRSSFGLGNWEAAFMASIFYAEGGSFGCFKPTVYKDAEECVYTIRNNITRFRDYLGTLAANPIEADRFAKALISTIALQYFRSGLAIAQNVLGSLAPGYLQQLNVPGEPVVCAEAKRLSYAGFLLSFIPDSWRTIKDSDRYTQETSQRIVSEFISQYESVSREDQFKIFASFFMPYIGLKEGVSGYCPIYDFRGHGWGGIFIDSRSPQGFKLNTNWGINVYDKLNCYFNNINCLPINLPLRSYF